MANLRNTTVSDSGFLQLPSGDNSNRPSNIEGVLRYNTSQGHIEEVKNNQWQRASKGDLGTFNNPALSGQHIADERPSVSSGYYWIQSPSMPNPLEMYVDMVEEGGGYDFYPIQNGTSTWTVYENGLGNGSNSPPNDGVALGLDMVYPRSPQHWRAMVNFVKNVLGESGSNFDRYFRTTYMIYRDNSTDSGNGDIGSNPNFSNGDYTSAIMRDPREYGSGAIDWRVPDGGRWWLADSTDSEPNGDYLNYGYLSLAASRVTWNTGAVESSAGSNPISESYNLEDLDFNDIASNRHHSTGPYYLVSTNAKP